MPSTPRPAPPTTVADVLDLVLRDPGRPRVTWYGDGGERVELSGAVLANWVTKATNLVVEEYDLAPGARVLVDLPTHWRAVVWWSAVWRAGATVVTPRSDAAADLVVTSAPERHPDAPDLVAVALPALARRWEGALPAGAVDGAAATMTYGDVLGYAPATQPDAVAVDDDGATTTFRDLVRPADPQRVVLTGDARVVLPRALGVLAGDGSVVLLDDAVAADAAHRERVRRQEHALDG